MSTSTLILLLCQLPPLAGHPDIDSIRVAVPCQKPRLTIVHLRDWHFIDFKTFSADVAGQVSEERLTEQYISFAAEVQRIQDRQERILRVLARSGHTNVWIEGLTPKTQASFRDICRVAARNGLYESPNPIHVGAAGRLFVEGVLDVHALDTEEGLRLAQPLNRNGELREITEEDVRKRESFMMQQLAALKGTAVIVLGGGHDLSDNVGKDVRLIEITVKGYREASGEQSGNDSSSHKLSTGRKETLRPAAP